MRSDRCHDCRYHPALRRSLAPGDRPDRCERTGRPGVLLESPTQAMQHGFVSYEGSSDGQVIGDFNGDGMDDIAVSFLEGENRNGVAVYHIMVLYGRPGFVGGTDFPSMGRFRLP